MSSGADRILDPFRPLAAQSCERRGQRESRKKEEPMAYFEIVRASGGFRAHFCSGGRIVWWTEVYVHKAGAQNAIATIKRHAATAPVYDRAKAA
jgi:uncharacterized protein YegP (UPF0339 family)